MSCCCTHASSCEKKDKTISIVDNLFDETFGKITNESKIILGHYVLDAVTSSGILKAKQKLGVTFNFDKQDLIDLTKISKMTMCRASEANSEK